MGVSYGEAADDLPITVRPSPDAPASDQAPVPVKRFSVVRSLRDARSAALMISNDRIHASSGPLHLVHKDECAVRPSAASADGQHS